MFLICGEALYDLFASSDPESSDVAFAGRIGGSPFNVAIGMARLGAASALFTGISTDMLGARLAEALEREGVDTRYVIRSGRRTTLSLVGLDASGSPSYAFYGVGSADCSVSRAELPDLSREVSGLHFGSYSIAVEPVADAFAALTERERHRFISLDPNVRPTVEPDMQVWRTRIDGLRRFAGLIKVSAEDLETLYPDSAPLDTAGSWASEGPEMVILTGGGGEVVAIRGRDTIRVNPPRVEVVDTVGAGDSFQATFLAGLSQASSPRELLRSASVETLSEMMARAAKAASFTCTRRGADLPHAADLA